MFIPAIVAIVLAKKEDISLRKYGLEFGGVRYYLLAAQCYDGHFARRKKTKTEEALSQAIELPWQPLYGTMLLSPQLLHFPCTGSAQI